MSYIISSQKTLSINTAFFTLHSWLRHCFPTWQLFFFVVVFLKHLDITMCGKTQREQERGCDSTEVKMGRAGEATGTHKDTLECTRATLHQWQFSRGRNRHTHPQTAMKRELEKHPTEQTRKEERAATVSLIRDGVRL